MSKFSGKQANSIAGMFLQDGYSVDIVVTDVNRWYLMSGTTVAHPDNSLEWSQVGGRLTYNGSGPKKFKVSLALSMSNDSINTIHEYALLKNGSMFCPCSRVSRRFGIQNDEGAVASNGIMSMNTGDYIESVTQADGASTATIFHITIIAHE